VLTAGELTAKWRQTYYEIYGGGQPKDQFFKDTSWHGKDEEYAFLFESLYDQPSQRREYI
jgi:hypothetical protein